MLNIQVGHSYFLTYDRKQWERGKPYPPLATIHVAALLRQQGHSVTLFDAMLADGVEEYDAALHSDQPQVVVFYEDNFNFLTKMCLARMREAACQMIAKAHAAGARVIVAGSDASDQPDAFLAAGADIVLIGEGIAALTALIERLDRNRQIDNESWVSGIAGVASWLSEETHITRIGVQPPDPRLVTRPAWDLIDIEKYRAMWRERHGYFSLNMAGSRGCPFRCNWCAKPIWGNHYKQRSARDMAAEMTHLKQAFRPDHIWMADDIFGFHVDWVAEFAQHLDESDGSIPFTSRREPT
jgi:anaerobic magnesium-protoporphyrin IX monomethyl ester cyclase